MPKNGSVVGYTFMAFAFTGLFRPVADLQPSILSAGPMLSARWLRYIGRISYGALSLTRTNLPCVAPFHGFPRVSAL